MEVGSGGRHAAVAGSLRRAFGSAVTRRQQPSAVRVAPAAGGGLLKRLEQLGDFVKFLGILTSARTAPEFIGVEPVQRATWLCLMLFCAEHETGGVIAGCRQWGDRRWMRGPTAPRPPRAAPRYGRSRSRKTAPRARSARGGGRAGGSCCGPFLPPRRLAPTRGARAGRVVGSKLSASI